MQCFYLHHRTFISCFVVDIRINIRLNHIPFASTKPLHIQFRELIHNTSYYISSNSPPSRSLWNYKCIYLIIHNKPQTSSRL